MLYDRSEKKLMINPRHKCKSHVKKNYMPQRVWRRKLEIIYSGTFPLGYLYSRDKVSDQVPEKCPHNLCIYYLFWRDTSIRGKGHFFGVPKPVFSLHSGDTLAIKKWLITKKNWYFRCKLMELSQTEISDLNWCTALVWIQHIIMSQR